MYLKRTILLISVIVLFLTYAYPQQQVTSIVTGSVAATPVSYSNIKGAGQRNSAGVVSSLWDSVGTSFSINYNSAGTNTQLVQFNVSGHAAPFIPVPTAALVRLRRKANGYVTDTRNHFNFWSAHASIPANGAANGSFNILGPEVNSVEAALLSNNIQSGYDNIFQNTITSLHAGNIERIDFILPDGIHAPRQYDVDNAGVLILDRGSGDPFKIAAITSVDGANNPLGYGPLVSVTAAQFGGNLLAASFNYTILIHDPQFGARARPSSMQTQNVRGVFLSLGNLGVAVNQQIYGYSLFGQDVVTADVDWNTYPTNTNGAAMLDPVNVLSFFRDVNSILPTPVSFSISKANDHPVLRFTLYGEGNGTVFIERSRNGIDFETITTLPVFRAGTYSYTDHQSLRGMSYYRLRSVHENGKTEYSEIRTYRTTDEGNFSISPNPTKDLLNIHAPAEWRGGQMRAVLFDANGRAVMERIFSSTCVLTISQLKAGTYFLRLLNLHTAEQQTKQVLITR